MKKKRFLIIIAGIILMAACALAWNWVHSAQQETDAAVTTPSSPIADDEHTVLYSLPANATTGFSWTAFVVAGKSVSLDEDAGGYVPDPNPEGLLGVGGMHTFMIRAVAPGESVIHFVYGRSWDENGQEIYLLASVDEDYNITTMDITESGVYHGTVLEVNESEHSVTLMTDLTGEVIASFAEGLTLPVKDENILVYTNGISTMSLPPIVNVLGWEHVPNELARD